MSARIKTAATAYYETLERTAANPGEWRDVQTRIDPACECKAVVELLQRLDREHHRLLFTTTLGQPQITRESTDSATVFLTVAQSRGREVDASGATIRSLPATNGKYALDLARTGDDWVIRRITKTS